MVEHLLKHKAQSKERVKAIGEVFTPPYLVEEILDNLSPEVWDDDSKTFLDNSCGHGVFLIGVLNRKIKHGHDPIQALSTIYGVDIMPDNVETTRQNLLDIAGDTPETHAIVTTNIVCHDALTYDYSFNGTNENESNGLEW
jgi:type I restriction-modification system DNA methylase subunit